MQGVDVEDVRIPYTCTALTVNWWAGPIYRFLAVLLRVAGENVVTDRRTDRRNDKPSTITLAAHARRGLMKREMPMGTPTMSGTHIWNKHSRKLCSKEIKPSIHSIYVHKNLF